VADLQELIFRGRFLMADAPERLRVFELVNGKRSTVEIPKTTKRHRNNVHRDLAKLLDAGLIQNRTVRGAALVRDSVPIFEKVPLARTIPLRYFKAAAVSQAMHELEARPKGSHQRQHADKKPRPIPFPTEAEILDIARTGETQLYEFKAPGTDPRKITRELAAMLNTRHGGIVFYGIDDDGNIAGSDMKLQRLDQPLQNSIRNAISPSAAASLSTVRVVGADIIAIRVPPWNRKDVYQFDEKILLRKGTNVFAARPDEVRKLHSRQYVI
jgi:predicted HTH transcriptional regulator